VFTSLKSLNPVIEFGGQKCSRNSTLKTSVLEHDVVLQQHKNSSVTQKHSLLLIYSHETGSLGR